MPYEIIRFPYAGAIDADGHVLEPTRPWEETLEVAYRPRALRARVKNVQWIYGLASKRSAQRARGERSPLP